MSQVGDDGGARMPWLDVKDVTRRDAILSESRRVRAVADLEYRSANILGVSRKKSFDVEAVDRLPSVEAEDATDRRQPPQHPEPDPSPRWPATNTLLLRPCPAA